jgi:hypothetical protein
MLCSTLLRTAIGSRCCKHPPTPHPFRTLPHCLPAPSSGVMKPKPLVAGTAGERSLGEQEWTGGSLQHCAFGTGPAPIRRH